MRRGLSTPPDEDTIAVSFFADAFRDSAVPSVIIGICCKRGRRGSGRVIR
jgi:hypothetical protein